MNTSDLKPVSALLTGLTHMAGLLDGWSQIPPDADGDYWLACAKSWRSETAYDVDCLIMVRVEDGKRVAEKDKFDDQWRPPDCGGPSPVWDAESQYEMLAAWRPVRTGENFWHPPQPPKGPIYERRPTTCPECHGCAATYRLGECNPWVCYSCNAQGVVDNYFDQPTA